MSEVDILLNVSDVLCGSYTNGPGKRVVIWVQGCTIGCKGCFNKEKQPHIAKYLVDPVKFANDIASICYKTNCEGVTLTGGEPFQQVKALYMFTSVIKEKGLNVACFSGYSAAKLLNTTDKNIHDLLSNMDVLIAGPFNINNEYPNRTWYDDPDKEVVFLTEAYDASVLFHDENVEYIIENEHLHITGFVDLEDKELAKKVAKSRE
nr:4Fe-4S single cluster domain-containing protein [uncultured Methanolobus sp.]